MGKLADVMRRKKAGQGGDEASEKEELLVTLQAMFDDDYQPDADDWAEAGELLTTFRSEPKPE